MSKKAPEFSKGRVKEFCRTFSATEHVVQKILRSAPWAIEPLNQIAVRMDEDLSIKETEIFDSKRVDVIVFDWGSMESIKFSLVLLIFICLPRLLRLKMCSANP